MCPFFPTSLSHFFQEKKHLQTSNPISQLQCQKHSSNPHMNLVVPPQKIHPTITSPFGFAGDGLTPSSSSYAAALPAGPRDHRRPWLRWWPREAKWHSCCMGCRQSGKLRMDWCGCSEKMGENLLVMNKDNDWTRWWCCCSMRDVMSHSRWSWYFNFRLNGMMFILLFEGASWS